MWLACYAKLFVERMCADWDAAPINLTKALPVKDGLALHQSASMFLRSLSQLEVTMSSSQSRTRVTPWGPQFLVLDQSWQFNVLA